MAIGDLLQVRLTIEDGGGKSYQNVFHYLDEIGAEPGDTAVQELGDAFESVVVDKLLPIIASVATVSEIEVVNIFDPTKLYSKTVSIFGTDTNEIAPRFNAMSFRSNRGRRDIRRGQKRFGPITELASLGGAVNPLYAIPIGELEGALAETLVSADLGDLYPPIVVKRIPYVTPGGRDAYRLPENLAEFEYFTTAVWEVRAITSQNTRKS